MKIMFSFTIANSIQTLDQHWLEHRISFTRTARYTPQLLLQIQLQSWQPSLREVQCRCQYQERELLGLRIVSWLWQLSDQRNKDDSEKDIMGHFSVNVV
jgi:hypothetical protein